MEYLFLCITERQAQDSFTIPGLKMQSCVAFDSSVMTVLAMEAQLPCQDVL